MLICVKICKVNLSNEDEVDENGNVVKKGGGLNTLGWVTWVTFYVDSLMSGISDIEDVIAVTIGNVIGFVIFFYIIYGIMSAVGVNSNDESARRNTACWINVIIGLVLSFLIYD